MLNSKINVIVLGANGQLGSDLIKVLSDIYEVNSDISSKISIVGLTRSDINIDMHSDYSESYLSQKISPHLVDNVTNYIINCIAVTNVDICEDKSTLAFLVNTDFVYKLAKFCESQKVTFFHISTDYVFDGNLPNSYTEESIPAPINVYGLSKYSAELAVSLYHKKSFIFRVSGLFGVAGSSGKGGNFITTMQRLGVRKDKINVISDQITCPTSTLAVSRAIKTFICNKVLDYGVYNCVSSTHCSWFEFSQKILELYGLDYNKIQPIKFADYSFIAKRPQYTILDTTKISKYYKMPTWQDSLSEYFSLV